MDEIDRVIAGLTKAQRAMLMRPSGVYEDNLQDIGVLLNLGIWGTKDTAMGEQVRARLQERSDALPAPPQEG
jgi:hypothetical protein